MQPLMKIQVFKLNNTLLEILKFHFHEGKYEILVLGLTLKERLKIGEVEADVVVMEMVKVAKLLVVAVVISGVQ